MALINGAKSTAGSAADAAMLAETTRVVMDFATATSNGMHSAESQINQLEFNSKYICTTPCNNRKDIVSHLDALFQLSIATSTQVEPDTVK